MDFKKRLIEELKLTPFQVGTLYNEYVTVCEKLAIEYHQLQLDKESGKIICEYEHHNADVRRGGCCIECGSKKLRK